MGWLSRCSLCNFTRKVRHMEIITNQGALFRWLGNKVKNEGPKSEIKKEIVDTFDDIIDAYAVGSKWNARGWESRRTSRLSQTVCVSRHTLSFVNEMANISLTEESEVDPFVAFISLSIYVPKVSSLKARLDVIQESFHVQSVKNFERHFGIRIDVKIPAPMLLDTRASVTAIPGKF